MKGTQVGRQAQHVMETPSCSQSSLASQVAEVEAPKSTGKRKAAAKSYSGDATGTQQSPVPLQVRKRPKQAKQALAADEDSGPSAAAAGAAEVLKPVAGLPGVQQRVQARPGKGSGGQLPTSDSPAGACLLQRSIPLVCRQVLMCTSIVGACVSQNPHAVLMMQL